MPLQRQGFLRFALSEVVPLEQLRHDRDTDMKTPCAKFPSNGGAGEIGPQDAFPHRIASDARADDVEERGIEFGKQRQAGLAATPFFLDRPDGMDG